MTPVFVCYRWSTQRDVGPQLTDIAAVAPSVRDFGIWNYRAPESGRPPVVVAFSRWLRHHYPEFGQQGVENLDARDVRIVLPGDCAIFRSALLLGCGAAREPMRFHRPIGDCFYSLMIDHLGASPHGGEQYATATWELAGRLGLKVPAKEEQLDLRLESRWLAESAQLLGFDIPDLPPV